MTKEKNFRKTETTSGKLLVAGKNSEQNEQLVKRATSNEFLLHTKAAGSPFVNIKGRASKKDIKEAAVFCARFSREWKKNKRDVKVHYFKAKDTYKGKGMKQGTFGVKKFKKITVKKKEILK